MNIIKATRDFERWLAKQIPLVRGDVALKHQHMAESPFAFFRATFYRWLQLWHANCVDVAGAPKVLAVGDLHIENFGTWRDQEGRLIWGVNDLDEAWPGPYTLDLIRLTASAYLAIAGDHLGLTRREAAEAVEEGYRDALNAGGQAFILAEQHQWLRLMALSKLRDPVHFWAKMTQNPPYNAKAPAEVRRLLEQSFSHSAARVRVEAPDRRLGQPGASENSGAVVLEKRVGRARSQSHSHLRVGLVSRRFGGKSVRRKAGAKRNSRAGSLRAFPRALAGSAAGPGLFAD